MTPRSGHRERFTLLGLLFAAAAGLAISNYIPVRLSPPPGLHLPTTVGGYTGIDQRFCQNERCLAVVTLPFPEAEPPAQCPTCGGRLDRVTLAENRILPKDTIILKRIYRNSIGQTMAVSVVISGAEQRSIHRPQQCLPAQGYTIQRGRVHAMDAIAGRPPLEVMILDTQARQRLPDGDVAETNAAYAYWFATDGRETPYYLKRLYWMGLDRLLQGVSSRWAYITIATHRTPGSDSHIERINRFLAQFQPLMTAGGTPAADQ